MGYSGAGGKLIDEKNQKRKISWHCLFRLLMFAKEIQKQKSRDAVPLTTIGIIAVMVAPWCESGIDGYYTTGLRAEDRCWPRQILYLYL